MEERIKLSDELTVVELGYGEVLIRTVWNATLGVAGITFQSLPEPSEIGGHPFGTLVGVDDPIEVVISSANVESLEVLRQAVESAISLIKEKLDK